VLGACSVGVRFEPHRALAKGEPPNPESGILCRSMDALSEALRGMRLTGAVILNAELTAPWGFASPSVKAGQALLPPGVGHLVLFHLVTEGAAAARVHGYGELNLEAGDLVVLPHGDAHELWNGARAKLVDGAPLLPKILRGSLDEERGGGGGAVTRFICGYFGCEDYAARLLLPGLPPLFKINVRRDASGAWLESSIRHLVSDAQSKRAGRAALLAKLAEALFVETLCRYMEDMPPERSGWLAGAKDQAVGQALACFHRHPSRAWTLVELAKEAGVSRTVLAERFTRLMGRSPLAYLARWRLQWAARLLETTDHNVLQIALDVGYESEAAFSRAFKREFEVPPARYRRRANPQNGD
jgi:AraC-like DNA-binding protein